MSSPIKARIEAAQQNKHEEMKPVVVRTLKDPPEIWDLVHETPAHFNPTGAFLARLTSRKSQLILATLGLIFISGLAAFVFMPLREGRVRGPAAGKVTGASVVDNTSPPPTSAPATNSQPTTPQPATSSPDNAASAGRAPNDSPQSTSMSEGPAQANSPVVSNVSKRTASRSGRAAWAGTNRVTIGSSAQNGDQPKDFRGDSATIRPDTVANPKTSPEKNSSDASSANKGSIPTLSPQLIAPPTTTPAPKAKVIQWP